jgi:hypothetical protein
LEVDELYAVLGCQLLALASPTRAADVMIRIFDLKKAQSAPSGSPGGQVPGEGLEELCTGLRGDGSRFVAAMKEEFRKGLCNENVVSLTEDVDEPKMQILIMIISAILKIPPAFESISATLAALLCKSMLKDICR